MCFCTAESRNHSKRSAHARQCCGATTSRSVKRFNSAASVTFEQEAARKHAGLGSFLPIFAEFNHLRFVRFKAPLTQRCQNVSRVIKTGSRTYYRLGPTQRNFGIADDKALSETTNENKKRKSSGFARRYLSAGAPLCSSRSPLITSYRHHGIISAGA